MVSVFGRIAMCPYRKALEDGVEGGAMDQSPALDDVTFS